jgi:hypothetical protein
MSCGSFSGTFTQPDVNATSDEIICRGSNSTYIGTNWFNFWARDAGTFCQSVFQNILYSGTGSTGIRGYNPAMLERVQNSLNNAFAQYQLSNNLGDVNTPNFNAFQQVLLTTCENIPGACESFQNGFCTNCTRAQVASTALLTRLCGCRAPLLPPQFNIIDPACDPLCNRADAIHNINTVTGVEDICSADVCVIDDINITATQNSNIGGGITFSQLCGGCKQSCTCVIASVDVNNILVTAGLTNSVQFSTSCANATCYVSDPTTGAETPVSCPTSTTFSEPSLPVSVNYSTIILVLIIVLIIVLAIFTIYL